MRTMMLAILGLALATNAVADPTDTVCKTNYKQEGNFFRGRQFSTWEEIPDAAPSKVFKQIYIDAAKSGLKITSSNMDVGAISMEQHDSDMHGEQITVTWNITIEASGTGSKISINKITPPSYATDRDFQIRSMCSVFESARK
jgi:hypothetical protein